MEIQLEEDITKQLSQMKVITQGSLGEWHIYELI